MLMLEIDTSAPELLLRKMQRTKFYLLQTQLYCTLNIYIFVVVAVVACSASNDGDFSLIKPAQSELCARKPL